MPAAMRIDTASGKGISSKTSETSAESGKSTFTKFHPDDIDGWVENADEVRDYFGDVVGLYFAWMEVYTSALRWPAVFGGISLVSQFLIMSNPSLVGITDRAGTVDDNPLTMAYTKEVERIETASSGKPLNNGRV